MAAQRSGRRSSTPHARRSTPSSPASCSIFARPGLRRGSTGIVTSRELPRRLESNLAPPAFGVPSAAPGSPSRSARAAGRGARTHLPRRRLARGRLPQARERIGGGCRPSDSRIRLGASTPPDAHGSYQEGRREADSSGSRVCTIGAEDQRAVRTRSSAGVGRRRS